MFTIRSILDLFAAYLKSDVQKHDSGSVFWKELKALEELGLDTEVTATSDFKYKLLQLLITLEAQTIFCYDKLGELELEKFTKENALEAITTKLKACGQAVSAYQKFEKEYSDELENLSKAVCTAMADPNYFRPIEELTHLDEASVLPIKVLDPALKGILSNVYDQLKSIVADLKQESPVAPKVLKAIEQFSNDPTFFSEQPISDTRIINEVSGLINLIKRFISHLANEPAARKDKFKELQKSITETIAERHLGDILVKNLDAENKKFSAFLKVHEAFVNFLAGFLGFSLASHRGRIREAALEVVKITRPQLGATFTVGEMTKPKSQMLEAPGEEKEEKFTEAFDQQIKLLQAEITEISQREAKSVETKAIEAPKVELKDIGNDAMVSTSNSSSAVVAYVPSDTIPNVLRRASHAIMQSSSNDKTFSLIVDSKPEDKTLVSKTSLCIQDLKGSPYLKGKIEKFCRLFSVPENVVITISSCEAFTDIQVEEPYNHLLVVFLDQELLPQEKVQLQLRRTMPRIVQLLFFRMGETPERTALSNSGDEGRNVRSGLMLEEKDAAADEMSYEQALNNVLATLYDMYVKSCNLDFSSNSTADQKEAKLENKGEYSDLQSIMYKISYDAGISSVKSESSLNSAKPLFRLVAMEDKLLNYCRELIKTNPSMRSWLEPLLKYELVISIQDDFLNKCKERECNSNVLHSTQLYRFNNRVLCSMNVEMVQQRKKNTHVVRVVDYDEYSKLDNYKVVLETAKKLQGQPNTIFSLVIYGNFVKTVFERCSVSSADFSAKIDQFLKEIEDAKKAAEAKKDSTSKKTKEITIDTKLTVQLRAGLKSALGLLHPNETVRMTTVITRHPYGEGLDHEQYPSFIQRDFEDACKAQDLVARDIYHTGIIFLKNGWGDNWLIGFAGEIFKPMRFYLNPISGYLKANGKSELAAKMLVNTEEAADQTSEFTSVAVVADKGMFLKLDPISLIQNQHILFEFDQKATNIRVHLGGSTVLRVQTPKSLNDLPLPPPHLVKEYDELSGTYILRLHSIRPEFPETVSGNHDVIKELVLEAKQNGESGVEAVLARFVPPQDSQKTRVSTLWLNGGITRSANVSATLGRMTYVMRGSDDDAPLITIPAKREPSKLGPILYTPLFKRHHADLYEWLVANNYRLYVILSHANYDLKFVENTPNEVMEAERLKYIKDQLHTYHLEEPFFQIAELFKISKPQELISVFQSILSNYFTDCFFKWPENQQKYFTKALPLIWDLSRRMVHRKIDKQSIENFITCQQPINEFLLYDPMLFAPLLGHVCFQFKLPETWDGLNVFVSNVRDKKPVEFCGKSVSLTFKAPEVSRVTSEVVCVPLQDSPVTLSTNDLVLQPSSLREGKTVEDVQRAVLDFAKVFLAASQRKHSQIITMREELIKTSQELTQNLQYERKQLRETLEKIEKLNYKIWNPFDEKKEESSLWDLPNDEKAEKKEPTLQLWRRPWDPHKPEDDVAAQKLFEEYKKIIPRIKELKIKEQALKQYVDEQLPQKLGILLKERNQIEVELQKIGSTCELAQYQIRLIERHIKKFKLDCDKPNFDSILQVNLALPRLVLAHHPKFPFELTKAQLENAEVKAQMSSPPVVEQKYPDVQQPGRQILLNTQAVLAKSSQAATGKVLNVNLGVAVDGTVSVQIVPNNESAAVEVRRDDVQLRT